MLDTTGIAGTCHICQQTVASHQIRQHLIRCIPAQTGLQPAQNPRRIAQKTACISVRAKERPHWLELGVRCDVTLRELDKFLRAIWLECCGHLSHFTVGGDVYSVLVPVPGEKRRFQPEDEYQKDWKHMRRTVSAAIPPLTRLEYEFDYGDTTELVLEHVVTFVELVQRVSPTQPWHGGKIVILAQNHPLHACLRCGGQLTGRSFPKKTSMRTTTTSSTRRKAYCISMTWTPSPSVRSVRHQAGISSHWPTHPVLASTASIIPTHGEPGLCRNTTGGSRTQSQGRTRIVVNLDARGT